MTLLVAGLLAACDAGATTPSEQPIPTVESSASAEASAAETMDDESPAAMTCDEAVAAIDVEEIAAAGDLESVTDELDDTIAACDSVADWEDAVGDALPGVDISDAERFITDRCDENATLAASPICEELAA
ncbi:MAG: hypothetical protein ACRDHD_04365 [Candidatus Limnocylindria bacterium]